MGVRSPSPTPGSLAQGSSDRKISPHKFCCKIQQGLSWQKKLLEPQAVSLKEPTHGLGLIPSELQHWGSSLKGTRGIQGGTDMSGTKAGGGGQLSPRHKSGQRPFVPLLSPTATEPQSHRASNWMPFFRLHQRG